MTKTSDTARTTESSDEDERQKKRLSERHLALGWGSLLLFIVLGLALEALHAFKSPLYLNADQETRRLLWRLAHAHGALLSILQLGASWTFWWLATAKRSAPSRLISRCLIMALVLLPAGFFLAGLGAIDGDPGVGIVLVPAGALFLVAATVLLFRATRSPS